MSRPRLVSIQVRAVLISDELQIAPSRSQESHN